jgi:hypothetical protein
VKLAHPVIGVIVLSLLAGCTSGQTVDQVCATLGGSPATPGGLASVPPPGYAFVDVQGPGVQGQIQDGLALEGATNFERYADSRQPGLVTGASVSYVLAGAARTGAARRVCSTDPMVLREFLVNTAKAPDLEFWKQLIAAFTGASFNESDVVVTDQDVARASGPLGNGVIRQQYLWLRDGVLFWVYGASRATAAFVQALLAAARS